MVNPTWEGRDLPVLRAIVELTEEGITSIAPGAIAKKIDMDRRDVDLALRALATEQPPFFGHSVTRGFGGLNDIDRILLPTGHALRTVGAWPKPENRVDQLIDALRLAADREADPEQRSALRKTAAYVGGVGRDLFVGIVSGAVTGS
ncbi:hypothetical protein [Micromonospora sp. NPDC003241]